MPSVVGVRPILELGIVLTVVRGQFSVRQQHAKRGTGQTTKDHTSKKDFLHLLFRYLDVRMVRGARRCSLSRGPPDLG